LYFCWFMKYGSVDPRQLSSSLSYTLDFLLFKPMSVKNSL